MSMYCSFVGTRTGAWVAAVVFVFSATQIAEGVDYFPLEGATWTYGGNPLEIARLVSISEVVETSEGPAYVWDGIEGKRTVRQDADMKVMELREGTWRLLFDLGAEVGTSWTIPKTEDENLLGGTVMTFQSRTAEVEVPLGTFKDCIHLALDPDPQLADAGLTGIWFAPDVGVVKWVEQNIAGPQAFELAFLGGSGQTPGGSPSDSTSGGSVDPRPGPFPVIPGEAFGNRSVIESDGIRYEVASDTSVYVQGDIVHLHYQVTSVERDDATFQFTSTQQIEFTLDNSEGQRVWTWSETRGFGDALTQFDLKIGESGAFEEVLDLQAVTVAEGTYTLTGFLPTRAFEGETVDAIDTEVAVTLTVLGQPDRARLDGEVRADDGTLLESVLVQLQSQPDAETISIASASVGWTDPTGRFTLSGLIPGEYLLTASRRGYHSATLPVSLDAGDNRVEVELKPVAEGEFINTHTIDHERFRVEMATEKETYPVGDSVSVRYRLTNLTDQAQTLQFRSGQEFDLVLDGPGGKVWQWSDGKLFIQVLSDRELAPGESFEFKASLPLWEGWAIPGETYLLTGFLAVSPDADGAVSREETEGSVKFSVDGDIVVPGPGSPDRLQADLKVDRQVYKPEDSVRVSYRLINTSSDPVNLMFPSGQRYDLVLDGPKGRLWRWSSRFLFDQATGEMTLAPSDTFAFRETIHLSDIGADVEGGYALKGFMTVTQGDSGAVHQTETEAWTRFVVDLDGKIDDTFPPLPQPEPFPGSPQTGRVDASLEVEFDTDVGRIQYRVKNLTKDPLLFMHRSGQEYEFVLGDEIGEVWRWSSRFKFTAALWEQELIPGDSLAVEETFPLPSAPGTYILSGFMTVRADVPGAVGSRETQARLKFKIHPGGNLLIEVLSESPDRGDIRAGNFNGDDTVDFSDFVMFALAFGLTSDMLGFDPIFDMDGNSVIGFGDLVLFALEFGK